jgi:hypothetical protein
LNDPCLRYVTYNPSSSQYSVLAIRLLLSFSFPFLLGSNIYYSPLKRFRGFQFVRFLYYFLKYVYSITNRKIAINKNCAKTIMFLSSIFRKLSPATHLT